MTRDEFLKFHKATCEKMHAICTAKNADYAGAKGGGDAFANFRLVEHYGVTTAEIGLFTRMSDKMARIASFLSQGTLQVKDESAEDTVRDLVNYGILLLGLMADRRGDGVDSVVVNEWSQWAARLHAQKAAPADAGA
jgi:hypothetical protein